MAYDLEHLSMLAVQGQCGPRLAGNGRRKDRPVAAADGLEQGGRPPAPLQSRGHVSEFVFQVYGSLEPDQLAGGLQVVDE